MGAPTIASKEWAYRQYDQQVGTNTLVLPGSDAAVLRIKGTRRAIAISTDGSGRQVFLDPRRGAAMAVCERRETCRARRPALGVTDCMNFGSPNARNPVAIRGGDRGNRRGVRALEVPVVGATFPSTMRPPARPFSRHPSAVWWGAGGRGPAGSSVQGGGQRIALLGPDAVSLGGSEYLWTLHGRLAGRLAPLESGSRAPVQSAVRAAVGAGLVTAAHDCAEGGLAVTLAEAAVTGRGPTAAPVSGAR